MFEINICEGIPTWNRSHTHRETYTQDIWLTQCFLSLLISQFDFINWNALMNISNEFSKYESENIFQNTDITFMLVYIYAGHLLVIKFINKFRNQLQIKVLNHFNKKEYLKLKLYPVSALKICESFSKRSTTNCRTILSFPIIFSQRGLQFSHEWRT